MICSICGEEFKKSKYHKPFQDVCSNECFSQKLWMMREEEEIKDERDKDNL